jgi:hypothetical protein
MPGVSLIIVAITVLLTVLLTIVAAVLLLILPMLSLLRLMTALLLGALVEGGGEILEGAYKMDAEITFGFVCLLDRLGHSLDGSSEVVE